MENEIFIDKINEIRKALELQLFNCALALSLTLPDICGKVAFPNKKPKQRYTLWFDQYAKPLLTSPTIKIPENNTVDYTIFTSDECWALRCSVLHAGNFKTENISLENVSFHVHKRNGYNYSHIVRDNCKADFDLIFICEKICEAAEQYYLNSLDKTLFIVDDVRIDTW